MNRTPNGTNANARMVQAVNRALGHIVAERARPVPFVSIPVVEEGKNARKRKCFTACDCVCDDEAKQTKRAPEKIEEAWKPEGKP